MFARQADDNLSEGIRHCSFVLLEPSAPQFVSTPFLYHEVNIHAAGNEVWNNRYGLKIPVLYLYRHLERDDSLKRTSGELQQRFNSLEMEFWDDPGWLKAGNGNSGWVKEVMNVMDFETKQSKFKNASDMAEWIWRQ
jgi:hypothetical protein